MFETISRNSLRLLPNLLKGLTQDASIMPDDLSTGSAIKNFLWINLSIYCWSSYNFLILHMFAYFTLFMRYTRSNTYYKSKISLCECMQRS